MNSALLHAYQALPAPLRSVAATARGYVLRSWRYGRETDALVEAALERDSWDAARWRAWQETRLAFVLHRAATQVPFYRAAWDERRRRGDRASWEQLENWPVLTKETLRAQPAAFVADDCDPRRMFRDHTSGTSGQPLDLWMTRRTVREWYALFEARARRWNGVSRHDRWAILGGQLVTSVRRRKPPFWVWNQALHQLYMSSYHLSPALIGHYLDALAAKRVRYVLGYTSSLYAVAEQALAHGRTDIRLQVAITNAEPVLDYQRDAISRAFQCPLRETYGMAEIVAGASECDAGKLHTWPEVGWIEAGPASDGVHGALLCTSLLNADMPLVRYRVGDRSAGVDAETGCGCGRGLPVLRPVEGRLDDVLYARDGRRIGRLDPVFKAQLPIRGAQIVQESLDLVRVRLVRAPGYSEADGRAIIARVRERMGDVRVELQEIAELPRSTNGKFRAVVCNLSVEERRRVGA